MVHVQEPSLEQLPASWKRRARWGPVALAATVLVTVLLETAAPPLDHGTHLLIALSGVLGIVLILGPRMAAAGLVMNALAAAAASVLLEAELLHVTGIAVQLSAFLLVGTVLIAVVGLAARPRSPQPLVFAPSESTVPLHLRRAPARLGEGPTEKLTARELEILRLAATGVSVEALARGMCVSQNTAKTHLTHVYAKLGVRGRSDAVRAALHAGLLTPTDICPHLSDDRESPIRVTTPTQPPTTI